MQFYDLANALLKTIGRKDFAKFIWEYAGPYVPTPYQKRPGGKLDQPFLLAVREAERRSLGSIGVSSAYRADGS